MFNLFSGSSLPRLLVRLGVLVTGIGLTTGCQPAVEIRSYDLTLSNQLPDPVTVFLTKNGPPDEQGWLAPEQLAAGPINQDSEYNGQVVPAGGGLDIRNIHGRFRRTTLAILRVYRQTGTLEDIAAIGPNDPRRLEVRLDPGVNELIIGENQWGLSVQREK